MWVISWKVLKESQNFYNIFLGKLPQLLVGSQKFSYYIWAYASKNESGEDYGRLCSNEVCLAK